MWFARGLLRHVRRKEFFQLGQPFRQSGQVVGGGQEQPQAVDEGLALPIVIGALETLRGGVEKAMGVASVELDLGQVEEAPRTVEWRRLLGLAFAEALGAGERDLVRS